MLQTLRDKTSGGLAFIILAAVTVPFMFFGVGDLIQFQSPSYVAKIGSKEISTENFRFEYERFKQMQRQQMGDRYSPAVFEQPMFKMQKLDQMINEEVLNQVAEEMHTAASVDAIRKAIEEVPNFQTEGKFDPIKYRATLESSSYTIPSYERIVKRQLTTSTLPTVVSDTAVVSSAEIDQYFKLQEQTRDYRFFIIPEPIKDDKELDQSVIQAYYDKNKEKYKTPEQVSISYLELSAAALTVPAEADDATLRARYEEQKKRFVLPEERLASHILVKVDAKADPKDQDKAKAKAAELVKKIRGGQQFAEVAKKDSEDLGSKAQAGDLGWLGKGVTQPAFETALFSMKAGDISDPIKTEEGYHIIQLREVRAEQAKTFEEVKTELADQFRLNERERLYSELSSKVMDQVAKDQTSLEAAAQIAGVGIKQSGFFSRLGGVGIAGHPQVIQEAFSELMLAGDMISNMISMGPDRMVLFVVDNHKLPETKPLDEVRLEVIKQIKDEASAKLAEEKAKSFEERFMKGESLDVLATELSLTPTSLTGIGRSAINQDRQIVTQAFKLPRPDGSTPSRGKLKMSEGTYALIEVTKVVDGDPTKAVQAQRDAIRVQLEQSASMSESRALVEALREQMDVRVVEERM